jgi:uncharacterized protein
MIKAKMQEALKDALRAKNKVRLDTIRGALSAFQYEALEKKIEELSDDQCLGVLQREIKKRKEEKEFAERAQRQDLIEKLKIETATLEEFLPAQMTEAEIERVLGELKAATPGLTVGSAMKTLRDKYPGQFDGKVASDVAKRILI